MGSGSTYSRLQSARALGAIFAAALAIMAASAPGVANGFAPKDISLRVVNNTAVNVSAKYCVRPNVDFFYKFAKQPYPCYISKPTRDRDLNFHGATIRAVGNPAGVILTTHGVPHSTVYFWVRNPTIGKPFFEINGQKVSMVEGELQTRHVGVYGVRFHREGDSFAYQNMTIEILSVRVPVGRPGPPQKSEKERESEEKVERLRRAHRGLR